jgi:hypothetical protein
MARILGTVSSAVQKSFESFESISTVTLSSTQSTITLSSIPGTYAHLQLRYYGFSTNMGTQFMEINGDTNTNNYRTHLLYGLGASAAANNLSARAAILGGGFGGQFSKLQEQFTEQIQTTTGTEAKQVL